jgi:hypothetical protein
MAMTVFVRTENGPILADLFIKTQDLCFQNDLAAAAKELSKTGQITHGRYDKLKDGVWSIWLEDTAGERHNFILYISVIELPTSPKPTIKTKQPSLGRWVEHHPGRPGDNVRWVDGATLIRSNFNGKIRDELLSKLERAEHGLRSFDGTIESTSNGVTLRVLAENHQVREFAAEIHLRWENR